VHDVPVAASAAPAAPAGVLGRAVCSCFAQPALPYVLLLGVVATAAADGSSGSGSRGAGSASGSASALALAAGAGGAGVQPAARAESEEERKLAARRDKEEKKRVAAHKLFHDRATRQVPDPYADDVLQRLRGLRDLMVAGVIADFEASLASVAAVEDDIATSEHVRRYALGRLVSEANADETKTKTGKLDATKPKKVRADNWSKTKQKALRFFELCQEFPAALGIKGVLGFCTQDNWTAILGDCFRQESDKVVAAGGERPLGAWPAWART
jgi:hypothetical protein